jgi:hypothetical protein
VGEAEQLLVPGGVGAGGGAGKYAAEVADGGCGEGVAVGVDADDAVDQLCQHGHAVVLLVWGRPWSASAWEESPRGTTVTGHHREPPRVHRRLGSLSSVVRLGSSLWW